LKEVADKSEINKMNEDNLAIVFGPSILRSEIEDPRTIFQTMKFQYGVVKDLILYCKEFFPKSLY